MVAGACYGWSESTIHSVPVRSEPLSAFEPIEATGALGDCYGWKTRVRIPISESAAPGQSTVFDRVLSRTIRRSPDVLRCPANSSTAALSPRAVHHRPVSSEPYLRRHERHDGYLRGCRNQRSSFGELRGISRLSPVDDTVESFGSRYGSCLLRIQNVASARCRATAPMAFAWPLRRARRS
jgi:hypothetical protein